MSPDSKILKAKRLEIAIAGTGLGIWELDVTNGENYTNDEWWEMLGYRKGEHDYSMDFFLSLLHPEDRYIPIETMNELETHNQDKFSVLVRMRHKNGGYRYIQDRGQVVERKDGKIVRMIGTHLDVTEIHELNDKLNFNQTRLESAIRGADLGVWESNMLTGENFTNNRWWEMIGYQPNEVKNSFELFFERVHPADGKKVLQAIDDLNPDGPTTFDLIIRLKHKNGQYRYIQDRGRAIAWSKGKATRCIGTHLDVTENYELNKQLSISESRLDAAIQGASLGVWDTNLITGEYFANEKWWNMIGYEPEETDDIYKLFFDIVHPEDAKKVEEAIEGLSKNGKHGFDLLVRIKRKDGKYIYVQDKAQAVEWKGQKPARLVGTHLEVTEVQELTKKLKFNEARLQSAIRGADLGVWDVNIKTGEQYANDRWYQMLGFKPEEVDDIFNFFNDRVHPEDQPKLFEQIENLTVKGINSFDLVLRVKHKDGSYRYIHDKSQAVEWEDGKAIRAIGTHLDVTEVHQLNEELRIKEARLDSAIRGANLGIWELDLKTGANYTNDRYWTLLGYQPNEVEYSMEFAMSLLHPDDQNIPNEVLGSLKPGEKEKFDYTARLKHKSGHYIHVHDRGQVIEWEDGQIKRLIGTLLDITSQVEHEEELRNSLDERENILEAIDSAFISLDQEMKITYLNSTAHQIFNISIPDVTQKPYHEVFEETLAKKIRDAANQIKSKATPKILELQDSKTEKWYDFKIYEKKDGYGLFIQDITETKMFHERMLENSIRSMENERNRISRELHDGVLQELTAAMMFAENLKYKSQNSELSENFEKLSSIVKKIANDTRKISHDLKVPELRKNKFPELLERLINNVNLATAIKFKLAFEDYDFKITLKERVKVNTYRVLQELIVNIIKHSQATDVKISASLSKTKLSLTITDNGVGVDSEDLNNGGIGIQNINERINQLDGSFEMKSIEPSGLRSDIIIPIE